MSSLSEPDPATQVQELKSVIAAVAAHNRQFSVGALLRQVSGDRVRVRQAAAELVEAGASESEAAQVAEWSTERLAVGDEQQLGRSILGMETAASLAGMGLMISPLRTTKTIHVSGGSQEVAEVRIAVTDGARFAQFLSDTATPRARPDDQFHMAIASIAQDILAETTQGVADGDPQASEVLAYAPVIMGAMKRHGLAAEPAVVELAQLAAATQGGYGSEYVRAKSTGVLEDPGSDEPNPSTWQRDSTTDRLAKRWAGIVAVIEAVAANDKARGFAAGLTTRAMAHLQFAQGDLPRVQAKHPGYGQGFSDVLALVLPQLGELTDRFAPEPDTSPQLSPGAIPRSPHGLPETGNRGKGNTGPAPLPPHS